MTRSSDRIGRIVAATSRRTALWRRPLATLSVILLAWSSSLWAQVPPAPSSTPPAPVVTVTRSWFLEAFIVVVMMGLALFVVCRSSRRN